MPTAFDGTTVVDLTRGMAGTLATMFLCDNGARVIRVEDSVDPELPRPEGYRIWNRGKENLSLDLSNALSGLDQGGTPESKIFDKLVRKADLLVETFKPGSEYQRLVDYDRLRSINPRLVHCSITGYGKHGPLRDADPDGQLVMSRTGIVGAAPTFRPGPSYVSHPMVDINAALMGAQGVVASLFAREKTGVGRSVEASLFAAALVPASQFCSENKEFTPYVSTPAGGYGFYSHFECADGEYLQIACIHTGFAEIAAAVMGIYDQIPGCDGALELRPRGEEEQRKLFNLVARTMKTKPSYEWERIFEEADVPYMRAHTVEEGMEDPQVQHNGMVIRLEDPEVGQVTEMGLPIKLSGTPGTIEGGAHIVGQDTDAILAELAQDPDVRPEPDTPLPVEQDPPLAGVRVLEVSNVIAGPVVGMYLAGLGADVIKMEPLTGEISRSGESRFFLAGNANKRSIGMNASSPEGREAAQRIAETVDIVTANTRPGAIDRMGIGREGMKSRNPRLVESYVTAFGPDGPYDHRPGLDPLAQALTGLQRKQGGPFNPPVFLGWQAPTDYTAGGMAALGAVIELFVRERTGICQRSDTNLLNAGAVVNADGLLKYDGRPPGRIADRDHYGLSALHRLYETSDGWIYIIAEDQERWKALCQALDRGGLGDDPRFATAEGRGTNDDALAEALSPVFKGMERDEAISWLTKAGVGCAPVALEQIEGYFEDPHTQANDLAAEHVHPRWGRSRFSSHLVKFLNTRPIEGRPTPLLGEHTREILEEAGCSAAEIDRLYADGIVTTDVP